MRERDAAPGRFRLKGHFDFSDQIGVEGEAGVELPGEQQPARWFPGQDAARRQRAPSRAR